MQADLGLCVTKLGNRCYLVINEKCYVKITHKQFIQIAKHLGFDVFKKKEK